ncbi:NAD(P)H-dependent oxidoreductase subunit E [bacterium]|jgi:NADH-quinone oxidoreductase subunit E/NADP-reducing hydrogenase subunit HndA|nr:NAD(P)H-dependent oxidoreductase subunit E [bacterium]MBR6244756.1 NAD(P)H-dependent oxidoreductase subunit E [bacterium]
MAKTTIKISSHCLKELKEICDSFNHEKGQLINVLKKAQEKIGYLPPEVQMVIAEELKVPVAKVYGVVSFYSFFTMVPKGKYPISICLGTACYVRGAEGILQEVERQLNIKSGGVTPDGLFSLDCLRCVGACGLAPVILIGEKVYPRVTPNKVKEILDEYRK